MIEPLARRALAQALSTGPLVTVVAGSGIMAVRLSPHDVGLQLLEHSTATALGLSVLILMLGPVCGAHFNRWSPSPTTRFFPHRPTPAKPLAAADHTAELAGSSTNARSTA